MFRPMAQRKKGCPIPGITTRICHAGRATDQHEKEQEPQSSCSKLENLSQDTPKGMFKVAAYPGPCFRRGAPRHKRVVCPSGGNKPPSSQNFKNSRNPVKFNFKLPYCDQKCSIHLGGIHLNLVCKLQIKTPCPVHIPSPAAIGWGGKSPGDTSHQGATGPQIRITLQIKSLFPTMFGTIPQP